MKSNDTMLYKSVAKGDHAGLYYTAFNYSSNRTATIKLEVAGKNVQSTKPKGYASNNTYIVAPQTGVLLDALVSEKSGGYSCSSRFSISTGGPAASYQMPLSDKFGLFDPFLLSQVF